MIFCVGCARARLPQWGAFATAKPEKKKKGRARLTNADCERSIEMHICLRFVFPWTVGRWWVHASVGTRVKTRRRTGVRQKWRPNQSRASCSVSESVRADRTSDTESKWASTFWHGQLTSQADTAGSISRRWDIFSTKSRHLREVVTNSESSRAAKTHRNPQPKDGLRD